MPEKDHQTNARINFEFVCVSLPESSSTPEQLRLGLQEKHTVTQDVACEAGAATFRFPVEVILDDVGAPADFRGGCVQGPRGGRFVYLSWGRRTGEAWEMVSRAKVSLAALPVALLASAVARNAPVRAVIQMTDAQGRTAAATLKPEYVTWTVL